MKIKDLILIYCFATIISLVAAETSLEGMKVVGNEIHNKNGELVRLRGVNREGTEYSCVQYQKIFNGPFDKDNTNVMKDWGINAIRLPLNEDCWLGLHDKESKYFGSAYRKAIIDYVNTVTDMNMAVLLDLHWAGGNGGTILATRQIPMPNKVNSAAFWKSVAMAFKDNSRVLFDLYNEPYPYGNTWDNVNAWKCWRDGDTCGPEINYPVAGMQDLVNAVRSAGSKNIILLAGIQYATSLTHFLEYIPSDPEGQLGASVHSYDFNFCRAQGCWDTYLRPVFSKYPVVATETGQKDCKSDFLTDFLHYADKNDLHYFAWSWIVANCSGPSLLTSYDGDATEYGEGYKKYLQTIDNGDTPWYSDTFYMFDDKMTHWVDDWSSALVLPNVTYPVYQNSEYSIQYTPTKDKLFYLRCWGCISTDVHKQVEMVFHGGQVGKQELTFNLVSLNSDNTAEIKENYPLSQFMDNKPIPAGSWYKAIIDLSTLPKNVKYDGIQLVSSTNQADVYIGKITVRAYYEPPKPSSSTKNAPIILLILISILSAVLLA
ncbi:galactose-binding domain-containing protein [Heterostelium album PN500]|uniref:Galactose-binding domain-containing protein n=1 Tax=Heterostelium pallidum (strain ATCC 26659 / Pp 5 / PN500) TaxID=670386 RepID=D3B3V1_HETP5|nr:galactose-binding domain-containing protein [Heterostelium album PN500]EFA83999.1 galactose-binding domain-containing protein [Heterostelium album PN500]|eukprot:XP_020436116.1 galactose-binding domain-containing protein [Heterostelium album PN500]